MNKNRLFSMSAFLYSIKSVLKKVLPFCIAYNYFLRTFVLIIAIIIFVWTASSNSKNTYTFSDGSKVFLHPNADLTIHKHNSDTIKIHIYGKAYFQIKDPTTNFIVDCTHAYAVAKKNTHFMVSVSSKCSELYVKKGAAEFIKLKKNEKISITLVGGNMSRAHLFDKGIIKKKITSENYLAWNTRHLIFKDTKMNEVKKTIEEVYAKVMVIDDPKIASCDITANFKNEPIYTVANQIANQLGVPFHFKDDTIFY